MVAESQPTKNGLLSARIPSGVGLLIIAVVIWLIIYLGWFGDSQYANLRRIEAWKTQQRATWMALVERNPGLSEVTIGTFTGGGGMVAVFHPPLGMEDELVLRRYLDEAEPPRPVRFQQLPGGATRDLPSDDR